MKKCFVLFFIGMLFFLSGVHVDAATSKKQLKKKTTVSALHKKQTTKNSVKKKSKKILKKGKKKITKMRKIPEKAAPLGYNTFVFPANKEYGFSYPIRFNVQIDPSHPNIYKIQDSRTKQGIQMKYATVPTDSEDDGEKALQDYLASVYSEKYVFKDISEEYDKKIGKEFKKNSIQGAVFVSGPFILDVTTSSTNSYIIASYKTIVKSFGKI